jgi:hypothetical protein
LEAVSTIIKLPSFVEQIPFGRKCIKPNPFPSKYPTFLLFLNMITHNLIQSEIAIAPDFTNGYLIVSLDFIGSSNTICK